MPELQKLAGPLDRIFHPFLVTFLGFFPLPPSLPPSLPSLIANRTKGTASVKSPAMALRSFCFNLFTVAILSSLSP